MSKMYLLFVVPAVFFVWASVSSADVLTLRRDLISVSEPASGSNHTITFTTTTAIPASGKIVITPEAGAFTIPGAMDFTDVDLLISSTQHTVAATPGTGAGSAVGVSVVTGTSGSITLTLNDTDGIAGSSSIEVRIGTNATFGATGDQRITNPGTAGSYDMQFETKDASSTVLDSGGTVIAIVEPVGLSSGATPTPTPTSGGGGGTRPTPCSRVADFTSDCLVNLRDLSIMMYNWPVVRNDPDTDLNRDGTVGIIDFSILLYWWTG